MKYTKKPGTVDAVKWHGDENEVMMGLGGNVRPKIRKDGDELIVTENGKEYLVFTGEVIAKDEDGTLSVHTADSFEKMHDEV